MRLSTAGRTPQIELAVGEHCTAPVLRILEPLTAADEKAAARFADHHGSSSTRSPKGPVRSTLYPGCARLPYRRNSLAELDFRPTDSPR